MEPVPNLVGMEPGSVLVEWNLVQTWLTSLLKLSPDTCLASQESGVECVCVCVCVCVFICECICVHYLKAGHVDHLLTCIFF